MSERERIAALRQGTIVHNDWTNVAPGTPGHVVMTLADDGLMSCRPEFPKSGPVLWRFTITPKGREELERARVADLAAIGVREILSP